MSQSGIYKSKNGLAPVDGSPEWGHPDLILELKEDQLINGPEDGIVTGDSFNPRILFFINFEAIQDPYGLWDNDNKKVDPPCQLAFHAYWFGFDGINFNFDFSMLFIGDSEDISSARFFDITLENYVFDGRVSDVFDPNKGYYNGYLTSFPDSLSIRRFSTALGIRSDRSVDYPVVIPAGSRILFKIQSASRPDLFNFPSIYGVPEGAINLFAGNLIEINKVDQDTTVSVSGISSGIDSTGISGTAIGASSTAIGSNARAVGDNQLAIGNNAGSSVITGGTDSIYLRNNGVDTETNAMRLGDGQINDTYVSGIYGSDPVSTNETVLVGDDGKLFGQTDSAFGAVISTVKSDVFPSVITSEYEVVYETIKFDYNSDYNSTTGVFTAPVDGLYSFFVGAGVRDFENIDVIRISLFVNSSIRYRLFRGSIQSIADTASASNLTGVISSSKVVRLDAGDSVNVSYTIIDGTDNSVVVTADNETANNFSGYLLKQL